MKSVILYRPGDSTTEGDPLEVNPAMVGAIEAYPQNPTKCTLNIFGIKYMVRGTREEVSVKLGWSEGKAEKADPKADSVSSHDSAGRFSRHDDEL